MIELQQISKTFGPLCALEKVSLRIAPGEVLGLLGENGAGKSTLMHILFGLLRPSAGTLHVAGRETRVASPRAAQRLGIGMVHQHFKLVPTLTVLQNLLLFVRGRSRTVRAAASSLLERMHWSLPLESPLERLTVGQQQRVEILKALLMMDRSSHAGIRGPTTLILDEPTAVLTPQEAGELFTAVRALRDAGTAVVFISHKLAEIRDLCDRVAILRRGRLVHEGPATELSPDAMAQKMVGSTVTLPRLSRSAPSTGNVVLAVENVSTSLLKNASLSVRAGEIVGIAGVDGNGQSDLARTVLGMLPPTTGRIVLSGTYDAAERDRLNAIACIAEDRHAEALVLPLSVQDNLLLKGYRRRPFSVMGWLRFRQWRTQARSLVGAFDIRCPSPTATLGRLSGGNQQKVVLARELGAWGDAIPPKPLVLAINPTRGLDVGATAFVLQKLLDARASGAAVLLIHSDLDELLAISDRVFVLYNGTLTDSGYPSAGKDEIGRLMLGIHPPVTPPPITGGGPP